MMAALYEIKEAPGLPPWSEMKQSTTAKLLKKRLVAGVIGVNLVVAGLIVFSLIRSKEDYKAHAVVTTQNIAQTLGGELSGTIANVDLAIQSVTDEAERQLQSGGIRDSELSKLIIRAHSRLPQLVAFRATDAKGDAIYGPKVQPAKTSSLAHRDYFTHLRDNPDAGLVISKPLIGGISGKWMIVLARRINLPDGGFAGLVYAGLSLDELTKSFSKINVGTLGSISLRDSDLDIIARNLGYKYEGKDADEHPPTPQFLELLKEGKDDGTFIAVSRVDSIERTFSFRKLSFPKPYFIAVGMATSEYLAPWRGELYLMCALLVLFSVVTSVSAWFFYQEWCRYYKAERDSAKKLRTIIDTAMDGFCAVDVAGGITDVSDTYCRITGYNRQELLSMAISDLEVVESVTDIASHIEKMIAQGGDRFESRFSCKNGAIIDIEVSTHYMAAEGGQFVCFVRDITESKRAEMLLRESEKRYRTIVENQVEFVCRFLPGGIVTFVNKSLADWAGVDQALMIGNSFYPFIHEDDRDEMVRKLESVSADNPIAILENRISSPDGDLYWHLWINVAFFDEEGHIVEYQGVGRDITERKQAEVFLVNAKEILEREVQERTALLTDTNKMLIQEVEERERIEKYLIEYQNKLENLSFEISNAAEKERSRIAGELHDQVGQRLILAKLKTDMLASKLSSPDHLQAIEDILGLNEQTLNDVRSLTFQMRPPILSSAGLVAAIKWLGEELENQYGLSVEVATDASADNLSYLIKSTLFQVVRELLLNVAKHARTNRAAVFITIEEGTVTIRISDEGVGFDPARTMEKHHLSGGFGLYNNSRRIEYLGGKLIIDSAPGKGCLATIVVPTQSQIG